MGFWSTLGSVRANRANFKQWERDEADNDVKRKELYQRNPLSEQELAQKQKLADTIIDTITIMDEQSESVSEDVETITQPIVGLSMTGGFILSALASIPIIRPIGKKHVKDLEEIDKKLTKEQYSLIIEANKENTKFKRKIYGDYDVQKILKDSKKYKKLIIPEDLKSIVADMHKNYLKLNKKMFRIAGYTGAGVLLSGIAAFLAATIGATKFQVGSSRVARYNARESLNDPKNFVIYTDEQIEQAKENLKNNPPKEKKGFFSRFKKDDDTAGFFGNMKNLAMNKRKYDAWKKENDKRDPRIMRELTAEELEEAKRDKEVIQRVTKKINNRAEEYSENMETAATTILGSSILLGGLMSSAVNWVLNKTGTNNKIASWVVRSLADKDVQEAYDNLLKQKPDTEEYKAAKKAFEAAHKKYFNPWDYWYSIKEKEIKPLREQLDRLPFDLNSLDERSKLYDRIDAIHKKYSDILDKNEVKKSTFAEMKTGLKEIYTKMLSSKMGRNIGLFGAIGTGVTSFIGLIMALKLQKNAARAGRYNAKEELRNNPQEFISYSEEEMKQVENVKAEEKTAGQKFKEYMMFIPTAWKHYKAYDNYKKGELKDTKALKEELKKLEVSEEQLREGKNLQRKLFNTFEEIDDKSQEYSENMEAASDISMQFAQLGGLAAIFAPFVTTATLLAAKRYDLLAKMSVNAADFISRFSFIGKSKFVKTYLSQVSDNLKNAVEKQVVSGTDKLDGTQKQILDKINKLKENGVVNLLTENSFIMKSILPELINSAQGMTSAALLKLVAGLEKLDLNKVKPLMDKLAQVETENINTFLASIKASTVEDLMNKDKLSQIIKDSKLPLDSSDIDFLSKLLGHVKTVDGGIEFLKGFVAKSEQNSLLQGLMNNTSKGLAEVKIGDDILVGTEKLGEKVTAEAGVNVEKLAQKEFLDELAEFKLTEFINRQIAGLPDNVSSLERYIESTKKISGIASSFAKDKKYYVRGLRAFARFSQNVPAPEISLLLQKALKLAVDEPEKFIRLMNDSEEAKKIFMTPALKTAMLATGITWGVICTALTFAVQSYFAKLQKEAGRLGVMKAMEDLQDDRIYADETPKSPTFQASVANSRVAQSSNNLPPNIQNLLNSTKDNKVAV